MERTVTCVACKGHGYRYRYNAKEDAFILDDCPRCGGKGIKRVKIIDKRKLSADEGLTLLPNEL